MIGPPKDIFPYVLDFCRSIAASSDPVYIQVTATDEDGLLDCVNNVRQRIETDGGEAVLGWKIWEWYGVMIEAEFHMLWRSSDGRLHDVTPNPIECDRVLFLPDPSLTYEEKQVNNVRRALIADTRVAEFITVADQIFAIQNEGGRAAQFEITLTPEEAQTLQRLALNKIRLEAEINRTEPGRNELCRCGSGKKFKRCCA